MKQDFPKSDTVKSLAVHHWPLWKKILFRFFFIFLMFYTALWALFWNVPFLNKILHWYFVAQQWAVTFANANIFHIKKVLGPANNGDTSWTLTWLCLLLLLSLIGCIIWSLIDFRRKNYLKLDYLLCLCIRYYLIFYAFVYGFFKLFALQMPFPDSALLASSVGDLLPMRLSWIFFGYSSTYQIFSGILEILAGTLLLFRRTATLGTLIAFGVFLNVMMLNLSYDIPLKFTSIGMVFCSLFLLVHEKNRLHSFFIKNKTPIPGDFFEVTFSARWMRITRLVLKLGFIVYIGSFFYSTYETFRQRNNVTEQGPIPIGMYDVETFVINRDTIPPLITDTLRWQDIIFGKSGGSVKSRDTLFLNVYNRGYFNYRIDSLKQTLEFNKGGSGKDITYFFNYQIPDSNTIFLRGYTRNDSLFIVLRKNNRHFQLTERQFHWLSESNR